MTIHFSTWQEVLCHLFERYINVIQKDRDVLLLALAPSLIDRVEALAKYAIDEIDRLPEDKANRWLGFIQGVLIAGGALDTEVERAYTRPLFHAIKGVSPSMAPTGY